MKLHGGNHLRTVNQGSPIQKLLPGILNFCFYCAVKEQFHPAVAGWFEQTLGSPTQIQNLAWPVLRKGNHALISAPTGSGKTLAAFLSILDELVCLSQSDELPQESRVLYISPLKALSNDIEKNLNVPLAGICERLEQSGGTAPRIDIMVRTGDTNSSQRARMLRIRPQIIVTTPESLYVLLTSESGRNLLSTIRTVIVDEIHAIVGSRRGSHLALSLERLEHLVGRRIQRIGLSATVKPLELVAEFLCPDPGDPCIILDEGHTRQTDVKMMLPELPLGAVMTQEAWGQIHRQLVDQIQSHNTCLIFVNNRRLCERLARHLSELLGQERVGAHHGSLSRVQRLKAENALKAGELKVMVSTASLELGIDIGSIDLVVQISSPRSIHTFLQRIGRSEHRRDGISKAILIPLTRDDLVECTALLRAMYAGKLEAIAIPNKPLDILAQQIVAEISCREYERSELLALIQRSYPYKCITDAEFEQILDMLQEGYSLRFGKRARYIFYDRMQGIIQPRRIARLSAITNGGAIAENFEYEVILEGDQVFLGTVHEDFAIESLAGDVFQLGNQFWRILRISVGKVFVAPAPNSTPSMPFWVAEAPGRTDELSRAVSDLREMANLELASGRYAPTLVRETGITEYGALQLAEYFQETKGLLGHVPSMDRIIIERFFDEAEDCHIVIHSPYGTRINRAWGLALRKRFCRKFNFELQAAATDDAILFSLSHTHSFALPEVFSYLKKASAERILVQALLDAPMFEIRWRWNASRALAILRMYGGKRIVPQIQKSQAQDLIALVFPDQIACAENLSGERQVPDHPLVNQTIHDCLHEAMDVRGWEAVLSRIESQEIQITSVDTPAASALSHEILNARPYAFLDDAPLEERRTRAVRTDVRPMTPEEIPDDLVDQVRRASLPEPRDEAELYDALTAFGILPIKEAQLLNSCGALDSIIESGRVRVTEPGFLLSGDRLQHVALIFPEWLIDVPVRIQNPTLTQAQALDEVVLGHMELIGPLEAAELQKRIPVSIAQIKESFLRLELAGTIFVMPGKDGVYCERAFWSRMRNFSRIQKPAEATPQDYMNFLFTWQHLTQDSKMQGLDAVETIARQLQGFAMPAESWQQVFKSRITDFVPSALDQVFLTGKFLWWRHVKPGEAPRRTVTRNVPIMILSREMLPLVSATSNVKFSHYAETVREYLQLYGASFLPEIESGVKLFPEQIQFGLKELIAAGQITSDSLLALNYLFRKRHPGSRQRGFRPEYPTGRWSLIRSQKAPDDDTADLMIARLFLRRYGIVFRYIAEREQLNRPWLSLVRVLRRLEMQGEVRSGRFIKEVWGEQFALPEALGLLDRARTDASSTDIQLPTYDPLNLAGVLFDGNRIAANRKSLVRYQSGRIVAAS
ncbi:MAG: DEAD/DEAH box helicase [Spirochaetia bacterium]|nr:DEAD/DEAH box helicase [Spirochaetia bacterium]